MEDYEILAQIQMAQNLNLIKSFLSEPFKFTTTTDDKILIEKKLPLTNWYEVIGTTTLKDLPDFCDRATDSPDFKRFGFLLSNLGGTTLGGSACHPWSIQPPGSD